MAQSTEAALIELRDEIRQLRERQAANDAFMQWLQEANPDSAIPGPDEHEDRHQESDDGGA